MEKLKTRYILIIGLLLIFVLMQGRSGYSDYVKGTKANPLDNFPLTIGEWSGEKSLVRENIYRILETDAILVSVYRKGRESVALSTVYYSDEKVEFHSPEGCNLGRGDTIAKEYIKTITLNTEGKKIPLEIKELIVKRTDETTDVIYYFMKSGNFMGANYLKFRYNLGLRYFRSREQSGGALITLQTNAVNNNINAAETTLENFIELCYPKWQHYL